jgi:ribosome-binding protein aMBF1 (putative translation factor)
MKEWEASQGKRPTPRFNSEEEAARKRGDIELGKKIQEAREARGWNRTELGKMISKSDGHKLTKSAIQNYETAHSKPRPYILDQLVQILELQLEGQPQNATGMPTE